MKSTRESIAFFFPDLFQSLNTYFPTQTDYIFPLEVSKKCPHPQAYLSHDLVLLQPTLVLACFIGFLVGILGYFYLIRTRNVTTFWTSAFLYFAFMNCDGFFLHCFAHRSDSSFLPILHCLDVMFTALSSFHICLGAIEDFNTECSKSMKKISSFGSILIILSACGSERYSIPFVSEFLYLGITAVASICTAVLLIIPPLKKSLFDSEPTPKSFFGLLIALLGASIFVGGIITDRFFCNILGHNHLSALSVGFIGCDIGFLGLWQYCVYHGRSELKAKKSL